MTDEQKVVMLKNISLGRAKAHEKRRVLEASVKEPVPVSVPVPEPEAEQVPPKTKKPKKKKIVYQSESSSSEEEIVYVKRKSKTKQNVETPTEPSVDNQKLIKDRRQNAVYKNIFG